jgi:hypothetical protein
VGEMKIYIALVEALKKKERQEETQFTTKIAEKTSLDPNNFRHGLDSMLFGLVVQKFLNIG